MNRSSNFFMLWNDLELKAQELLDNLVVAMKQVWDKEYCDDLYTATEYMVDVVYYLKKVNGLLSIIVRTKANWFLAQNNNS